MINNNIVLTDNDALLAIQKDTGKSFSAVLIFASTNPKYDKRLSIELQVQYMEITRLEHVLYKNCSECQSKNNLCKQHVLSF